MWCKGLEEMIVSITTKSKALENELLDLLNTVCNIGNVPWKINTGIGGAIGLSLATCSLSHWYELRSGGNWGHAP